ncbi:Uncharacterised protein [Vibrio cholerae]|nr:Uncharacterised protein [Vibrio cholerae]
MFKKNLKAKKVDETLILLLEPLEQWFIICFLYDSHLSMLAVMMAKKEKISHASFTFSRSRSAYR